MSIFDLLRDARFEVVRNGKTEHYRLSGTAGEQLIYLTPLDKEPPSPPPAEVYILKKHHTFSKNIKDYGVYATQERAKDSAHYWARQERVDWAKLIEKPVTWEESDVPLTWAHMVDDMHGNPTSWICATAGLAIFVIEHHTVKDSGHTKKN